MIQLRFYRDRYNMDEEYYTGDDDIYCVLNFKTLNELRMKWNGLFEAENHWLEGETYSAWRNDGAILCGGAFDPGDIEYIVDAYEHKSRILVVENHV